MSHRTFTACATVALAFSVAAPAAAQTTVVATVGFSQGCEFDDLQQAVDFVSAQAADRRILRLERTSFENVVLSIDAEQLEIVGGFESCGDPAPGSGRTTLAAPELSAARVLSLEPPFSAPRGSIRLEKLTIRGGGDDFGGGVQALGAVDLVLADTLIIDNEAEVGGGVYLADGPPEIAGSPSPAAGGGPTLTLLDGSGVNGNRALGPGFAKGGGIACEGTGRIVAEAGSGVVLNESGGRGGGIFVDGCELRLVGSVTVSSNRARTGAGIHAVGSSVRLRGTAEGAVRVINNTADGGVVVGVGGGVAMIGPGAELVAENARIDDNRALPLTGGGAGGGLVVFDGAVATLDRTLGSPCAGGAACSSLSGNRASDSAAARVSTGGRLEIRRTAVHGNVALDAVLRATNNSPSAQTLLRIESSTLTANSGRRLLEIHDRSRLEAVFSTLAGNFDLERTIRGTVDAGAEPGEIQLTGSILYDPSVDPREDEMFELDPEVTLVADCLVVPDEAVVPEGPLDPDQVATTADPQFVDIGQRDLHLSPTSPALDACFGPPGAPPTDLDLDLRGHDLPEVPDRVPGALFDAGADEIGPPAPIFADGFETGDTTAWSATVSAP